MIDAKLRPLMDPALNSAGWRLARAGIRADHITLLGLAFGLLSAAMLAINLPGGLAMLPLIAGRICDGLDGAVARVSGKSDWGGFLDIVADFAFYGAIPLAFAARDPTMNGLPAALLLCAFYINGASFLGFATMAAKRGMETRAQGEKSLYFSAGLMEGGETILFFLAFCLWPGEFPVLAWIFAILCLVTASGRIATARRLFSSRPDA